jgi:four helix bundle protein
MQQRDTEQQLAWERERPKSITSDVLWKLDAYRVALYLLHVVRLDSRLEEAARADPWLISQLVRAAGSVSANLSEGYSRSTRADRLRFLGYALGSVRECIPWYEALRSPLADDLVDGRLLLVARIRSLLVGLIGSMRHGGGPGPGRLEP